MSKASQRRQAEQRKREAEVRGSPEKRLRLLMGQGIGWEAPARFWRECIKHLPKDPETPTTDVLNGALMKARVLLDLAASNWTKEFYDTDDDPDEILPGLLMPFTSDVNPRFGSRPFSLFGRVTSESTDMKQMLIDSLPPDDPGGLWVFGTVATARGETFVLAVHRDGTATASVRVQGQWIDGVPTFVAPYVATMTVSLMIDESATEAAGIMEAASVGGEEWADLKRRTELLRRVCDDAQMPYLRAMWRMAMNQLSEVEVGEMKEDLKAAFARMLQGDRASARKERSDAETLRAELQAARARERTLLVDLEHARTDLEKRPAADAPGALLSPSQRLSGIF